ncbi:hypothetical protein [Halobellus captivus]|uniref:hypothetical protein n=1 Tax=Halobellus captivus TaxID=2592614 RepID=UPI00119FEBB9|nr:hypothetical protein [Halobellus captivus]
MAMQPQSSFDALSRVLERLGSGGRSVCRAEAAAGADADGPLRATVEIAVPICAELEVAAETRSNEQQASASVADGALDISIQVPVFPEGADDGLSAELPDSTSVSTRATDVRFSDGDALVTLSVRIDSNVTTPDRNTGTDQQVATDRNDFTRSPAAAADRASAESETRVSEPTEESFDSIRDESVPPYDDTAYLQHLYDTSETFQEMSRRIEMDVSAETVRRYMIDAGVHSPASYETNSSDRSDGASADTPSAASAADASKESAEAGAKSAADRTERPKRMDRSNGTGPTGIGIDSSISSLPDEQLVTDGIGLPDRLTLRDVVDAVVDARTVHEVQRELGLEHDRTRRLLRQLNVLDLVLRRVASDPDRSVTAEAVAARIRESAPDGS